ncbi:hypothetical protein HUK80_17805 [Flavobacterium sp. MAH-1]|uniref:Lipoprotein n=1 Tax=Flavobacterium agri TaxID=2743471 RepID=A0A7Y8Y5F5_9FLAO|nr:hypothetical protein [Flavobacterium agri]NUY82763.1 hypothetical protein [Flavobacterium agri]NYA72786.1 hypothetical protein [Flavobacterium agri]
MKQILLIISIVIILGCSSVKTGVLSNNETLRKIETFLNDNIPQYKTIVENGFSHTEDGTLIGYSIYDLTDTTNVNKKVPDDGLPKIKFVKGHFYHVSPVISSISYSSIFYFDGNDFRVFKFVNCPNLGIKIDEVLEFADKELGGNPRKVQILTNIENYRKFGYYIEEDNYSQLNCN